MWASETGYLLWEAGPLDYKSPGSSAAAASSSSPSSPHTLSTAMSHVDVKNLKPSSFEEEYYDKYEYYNLTDKYAEGSSRKGRTKKEASENTNRPNPGGHERKITEKLQNSEKKEKE